MKIEEKVFTLNDIANHIISIGNGVIDGKTRNITNLNLNSTLFLTVRNALRQHFFNEKTVNQIVNIDGFVVSRYTPVNLELKNKYEIYSGNPIIEIIDYNFELGFLNDIIIKILDSKIELFDRMALLRQEKFIKQELSTMNKWYGKNKYTYDDIINTITINDISDQILALVYQKDEIDSITNLELQCIMFSVIKEATENRLFSYLEIEQLINKDGFYMNRVSPFNKEIQQKYSLFSTSPIMVKKELHTNLNYLNELIIKNITNIKSSNIFEKLSHFYKNIIISYKIKEIPDNEYISSEKFTLEEMFKIENI